ncbi:hypothetical protein D3C75_1281700 [compost metagenome]
MNVRRHFIGVPVFNFLHQFVWLKKGITLLVDIKLFETNIRNTVGQVFGVFR